ncbi:ankyrin repeat and SAM domain-containing protein 3 [Protopterus annectens]|uniref:ankyrin repeat and SAM domain-containing protein 3 n=1 Tax=Protopterus annectens TaxID=7888 RepID=UPI001CFA2595|nr:ankyrin repeat and SAM domain-containing protein 3 [Protopterus annectens]
MSEYSDEASESELLNRSLSMWHGGSHQVNQKELDVPLDQYTAASVGQYDVIKDCILSGNVDLNKKNRGDWTPLMYASYIGHDTIVHLLLDAGVDVNVTTEDGQTPLMLAASCGNESIAYFLLQHGAELEMKDNLGWTALLHCTSNGHQQMVRFFLDNKADANVKEPVNGFTPLMEAAASGHEIIVQHFLNHGVKLDEKDHSGATARTLAMRYGHMKIVGLIDMHIASAAKTARRCPVPYEDLSSSDESNCIPQRQRPVRKSKGPSIHDGPQALARITAVGTGSKQQNFESGPIAHGYVTFNDDESEGEDLRYRDVTSPINEHDVESNSSHEENAFFTSDMMTIRSSSSSSEGLAVLRGSEGSLESNEDSDTAKFQCKRQVRGHKKSRHCVDLRQHATENSELHNRTSFIPITETTQYSGPKDLKEFLDQIGCGKYISVFEEQDVDLQIFLTLTESDLKEIGITLFGPKRKMTSAIARWHSSARPPSNALEQTYADRLEAEMQEMAIQLHKKCEEEETLKGQVAQERELRTVVEHCLIEHEMAWKEFQKRLTETKSISKDMGAVLEQIRLCQAELSTRLNVETIGIKKYDSKQRARSGVHGLDGKWSAMRNMSPVELITSLDKCTAEMGQALQVLQQNLEKLKAPDKGKPSWTEP